ncbi:hypothetical protein M409DRAFT_50856 [Zasmidium cellare ATCC 36951]|uniref:BTB domain-containing protein n=1 Tax=Zasmidium cellare ATCC 36951 TaxID=1080233 RepID=A0A6A6CWD2_ZASCE|nr:uncharacterized protein M409DRAFT_50856 [Zasmidium cellare ATCC 36951]KAF2171411.1 hypothetical protein M409DRAFT_50856 [Zasmidium cellare ATCC 36951]
MATSPGQQPTPQSVFESMQSDHLVSIFVGNATTPLRIQQSIIAATSDYFKAVFTNKGFEEAKKGVLHLPEDDLQAWELFIYWLVKGTVWEMAEPIQLIQCWNLGDKYGISQLQDDVMWLLFSKHTWDHEKILDIVKDYLDASVPGSRLRKLPNWDRLCDNPEVCKDLLAAITTVAKDTLEHERDCLEDFEGEEPMWMRYMVGNGPNTHGNASVGGSFWFNSDGGWYRSDEWISAQR